MRAATVLVAMALVGIGCGGDNFAFCDGCKTPTPVLTATPEAPTPTGLTPTPAPSLTPRSTSAP
jgi:hypothetical protein